MRYINLLLMLTMPLTSSASVITDDDIVAADALL